MAQVHGQLANHAHSSLNCALQASTPVKQSNSGVIDVMQEVGEGTL